MDDLKKYLQPTRIIESKSPLIVKLSGTISKKASSSKEKAIMLYYWVRDEIIYDPYSPFHKPEHYKASFVLKRKKGFCIPKASLLCALLRAQSIPSRLAFADVKNHLATKQILERLGTDLFVYHSYVEIYLDGKWIKVSPAFNKELCERFGVPPLDFDGENDAILQEYVSISDSNPKEKPFMEYVKYHGHREDVSVEEILEAWKRVYGEEKVLSWIKEIETKGDSYGL